LLSKYNTVRPFEIELDHKIISISQIHSVL
jgi:hypothetical protein